MAELTIGHRDEPQSIEAVAAAFAAFHPGYSLGYAVVEGGEQDLTADGRARLVWVDRGVGEVWLEEGYRTNEGDGVPLPPAYACDPLGATDRDALQTLARALPTAHPGVAAPLRAIVERYDGRVYRGEMAGDVWRLRESGVDATAWLADSGARAAADHVLARGRALGWATRTGDGSFERFAAGDQLLVTDAAPLRVRGAFGYWWLDTPPGVVPPGAPVRRLRYLKDTAGGCAPGFDAFRRLPLTWQSFTEAPERPDGINVANSHVVNIAAEQSRTHYHPGQAVGGGTAQTEFYFVLDPAGFSLGQAGRRSFLHAFPDIGDWSRVEEVPLRPGTVVLIPPGTGHRGLDALVNVVTLPGFKPRNEIYVDALIAEQTGGRGAFNPTFAAPAAAPATPEQAAGSARASAGARRA
jgi:hypothetical protein